MLLGLEIRDILIIDRLELAFQPGLNVLTGETGAGKSILLDSLGFVLGWRGRAELVRKGASQGEVTAEFDLPVNHPARAVLAEAGIACDDTLILRRVNTVEGRKTAWVNDRRCSGEVLRALSETLIELHGQHDDRGLLNPRHHRSLLDAFAGLDRQVAQVREAWRALSQQSAALEALQAEIAEAKAEEEFLRHSVSELTALDPQPGEDEALDTQRRLMQSAERIREDIARAAGALGIDGAEGSMGDAMRWLEDAADKAEGQLEGALASLGRALIELGEAQQGVETCLDNLNFNPQELENTEERLFALRALARKHQVMPDDLAALRTDLSARLDRIEHGADRLAEAQAARDTAQAAFDNAAAGLSAMRKASAARLDQAVMDELAPLKMDRAFFQTDVAASEAGPSGIDDVSFTVATNPGAPAGPLAKIASGGELSRFLLALKVCLSSDSTGVTMIFDEIDRGVGGATADAVGRRLKALAEGSQVLVVTHSPQVAAQGAHHWQVAKTVSKDTTLTSVAALDQGERIDEIARMISGDTVTDAARTAAKALLQG
ncbi:MAG: DNA repair protein RecN [Paracoccaceae bacterium]|jgi:DNA repair protein RecN (Recombination protein N)|nr:DNA repair protein RecN [Paracoccaceae bacterium]MDP7185547.1 DNA repair protein RecN [Paracoccaceae bacterium]